MSLLLEHVVTNNKAPGPSHERRAVSDRLQCLQRVILARMQSTECVANGRLVLCPRQEIPRGMLGGAILPASAKPPISLVSGIDGIEPQDRRRKLMHVG